jgi:hypothetical protein
MTKRRVRQPYVITKLHNGNTQTEIVWELCIEDAEKRNKGVISAKPYPNHYNVHLDYGDKELLSIFDIQQAKHIFI